MLRMAKSLPCKVSACRSEDGREVELTSSALAVVVDLKVTRFLGKAKGVQQIMVCVDGVE